MEELGLQSLWGKLKAKQKTTEPDVACGLTARKGTPSFLLLSKLLRKIQVSAEVLLNNAFSVKEEMNWTQGLLKAPYVMAKL